jgi:hypothetical protein
MKTYIALLQIKPDPTVFIAVFVDQPGKDPRATIGLQHGATAADVVIAQIGELDSNTRAAGVKWPLDVFTRVVAAPEPGSQS